MSKESSKKRRKRIREWRRMMNHSLKQFKIGRIFGNMNDFNEIMKMWEGKLKNERRKDQLKQWNQYADELYNEIVLLVELEES